MDRCPVRLLTEGKLWRDAILPAGRMRGPDGS